jgi:tetratricopeptide (TPR) repeat protein
MSTEAYLRLDSLNAQAHLLLGRAYHNQNETMPAIAQFKKPLALDGAPPLAHCHPGFAYKSLGNWGFPATYVWRTPSMNPVVLLRGNRLSLDRSGASTQLSRRGV